MIADQREVRFHTDATAITVVKRDTLPSRNTRHAGIGFRYCRTFFGVKSATVVFDAVSVRFFAEAVRRTALRFSVIYRKAFFVAVQKGAANNGSDDKRRLHFVAAEEI